MTALPNNLTPYVLHGGQDIDASMPRLLVTVDNVSGSGLAVTDANNVLWIMIANYDVEPAVITYYHFGTTTQGTPVAPVVPYEYTVGSVSTPDLTTIETDVVGNGNATNATPLVVQVSSKGTLSFVATGTWTGTAAITGSIDGTNYTTISYANRATGVIGSTFTSNLAGQINIVGLKYVKFSGVSTGTLTLNYVESRQATVNTVAISAINGGTP